jgi:hypothetical protein
METKPMSPLDVFDTTYEMEDGMMEKQQTAAPDHV